VALPERIGRYLVERLLGQGAMGSVYLGKDPSLDRWVAIKTVKDLDLEPEKKQRFLDRFKNEARAAGRLSHASIVQVYDVGEDEALGPFLVLEYVRGSSLKQVVREAGPLPPARLCEVARELGGAIDAAHAAGILHRDIKPDNVLVGEDGRAKLADFGIARVPDAALTKEGQFLGTPCYAAPETLAAGRYSPQSDLFSFGALLYELASGTRAFPGDDALAVAHTVLHEEPPAPSAVATGPGVPPEVDRVLLGALAKEPGARPASAAALAEQLRAAYEAAGALAAETGRAAPPSSAGGGPLGATLGLLGLAAVGVAVVWTLGGPEAIEVPDAASPDASGPERDAGAAPGRRDAGADTPPSADTGVDAAPAALDAPDAPDVRELSRAEREDLAKDEIDRARDALTRGERAEALRLLEAARALDPESSDLEELEQALEALP
jgi:predicted Ser/Thr protein kinase